jgi:hypothetical protein
MIGPGKYDLVTEHVRKVTGAQGGVIVLVLGGDRGSGFSANVRADALPLIPGFLREMASQIEQDTKQQAELAKGN